MSQPKGKRKVPAKKQFAVLLRFLKSKLAEKLSLEHGVLIGAAAVYITLFFVMFPYNNEFVRRFSMQMLSLAGAFVSSYAVFVEKKLAENKDYEPLCVTEHSSCANVFKSSESRIFSHWGLVAKDGDFDVSLALLGVIFYSVLFLVVSWRFYIEGREKIILGMSLGSMFFSGYLLYILAVVLKEFCIVCTTLHALNFCFLILAYYEYKEPSIKEMFRHKLKTQ